MVIKRGASVVLLGLTVVVGVLVTTRPVSASVMLGTATGGRGAEMSLDGGRVWLSLAKQPLPILGSADIRSSSGAVALSLREGASVELLPFSTARVAQTEGAIDVTLVQGRAEFVLPAAAKIRLRTSVARLEGDGKVAGEIVVTRDGVTGVRAHDGRVRVTELVGERRVLVAAVTPIFVPRTPEAASQVFDDGSRERPGTGRKAVFTPKGESVGYLDSDGHLTVQAGHVNDLTGPYPQKLVRAVVARIPEDARQNAVPLFNVNGGYVGYLVGPTFYPAADTVPGNGGPTTWTAAGAGGGGKGKAAGGSTGTGGSTGSGSGVSGSKTTPVVSVSAQAQARKKPKASPFAP